MCVRISPIQGEVMRRFAEKIQNSGAGDNELLVLQRLESHFALTCLERHLATLFQGVHHWVSLLKFLPFCYLQHLGFGL